MKVLKRILGMITISGIFAIAALGCGGGGDDLPPAETPNALESIAQGRVYLFNNDSPTYPGILLANQEFKEALQIDPENEEANLFYSVTRVMAFVLEQDNGPNYDTNDTLGDLFGAFGMIRNDNNIPDHGPPFSDPPETVDGHYDPPPTIPDGEDVRTFLAGPFVDLLDDAIGNLDKITSSFTAILTASELGESQSIEVDYGDVMLYKSALYMIKAFALLVTAYDLDVDINDIVAKIYDDSLDIKGDIIDAYPDLLNLTKGNLSDVKESLVGSIDAYLEASDFIRGELAQNDPQNDELIAIDPDPEDLDGERYFRVALAQVKDSLQGATSSPFTVELSQVLDLGEIFENPFNLRDLFFDHGRQSLLENHILPQVDHALDNLAGVDEGFNQVLNSDDYPVDEDIEVDFGDIALIKSALYSSRAGIKIACAYDIDGVDIYDILEEVDDDNLIINDLLNDNRYSNLLKLKLGHHQLGSAKNDLENAIDAYNGGSHFIRVLDDANQADDLITINDQDDIADDEEFTAFLDQLQGSLTGPTEIGIENPIKLDLTAFFDEPYIHLGDYLPDVTDDNKIISYTFPDPTLSGIFPDFGQEDWSDWLGLAEFERTWVFSDYRYFHHNSSEEYLMMMAAQVSEDTHNVYVQNVPNAGGDVQLQHLPGWDDFYPYLYTVGLYSPVPGPNYEEIEYRFYVDENGNGSLDSGESTKIYSTIAGSMKNLGAVQNVTVSGDNNHPRIEWEPTIEGAEDFYMVRIFPVDSSDNPDFSDLLFQSYFISKYSNNYYTYWGNLFEVYGTLAIVVVAFDMDAENRVINQSRYCINH